MSARVTRFPEKKKERAMKTEQGKVDCCLSRTMNNFMERRALRCIKRATNQKYKSRGYIYPFLRRSDGYPSSFSSPPFLLHFYVPSPLPSLIAKRYIVSVATHSVPRIHCLSHSVRLRSATAYLVWNLAWNNFHRLGVLRNAISLKYENTRHLLFKQTFVTTKFVSKTSILLLQKLISN